jgi:hypothetical protein
MTYAADVHKRGSDLHTEGSILQELSPLIDFLVGSHEYDLFGLGETEVDVVCVDGVK